MDELRQLPHSVDAEQSVLGAILLDAGCATEVVGLLSPDDFYETIHQDIYSTIQTMNAAAVVIDPVTIVAEMRQRGVFRDTTLDYFKLLMNSTPSIRNIKQYATIVHEYSLLRQVAQTATEISGMALEKGASSDTLIDLAEQSFFNLRKETISKTLKPIPEILIEVLQDIREMAESGGHLPGAPTGIAQLDDMLGGLINSNFIIIASRPGVGKTSLALSIARNASKQSNKAIAFFSLEMSRHQLVSRMLSSEAEVDSGHMLRGTVNDNDWQRLHEARRSLSRFPMFFDDNPGINVIEMKSKCRRIENLGLIIVDYLQLMQGTPGKRYDNRTTEVSDISRNLKILAKELDVPVLCMSQVSRDSEKRADKKLFLSDLRESGAIEQDADVIMFLQRDMQPNSDSPNPFEATITVAKNRHGSMGEVPLKWSGQFTKFDELDWQHDEF